MDIGKWGFHYISMSILIGLFISMPGMSMSGDWVHNYHNFTEIYEESVIVIRGVRRDSYQASSSIPQTIHQVTILEMIKGEKPAHIISVSQTGGYYWICKFFELDDYPLFRKGDELILFLRSVKKSNGMTIYVPLGGPQGSYKVIDNEVYTIGNPYNPKLDSNGTNASTFIEYLKNSH